MSDIRDDLRELLESRAGEVPPHRDVPRSLAGRARRRIALNALGAGLVIVVVAAGAVTGLRAFSTGPDHQPAISPPAVHQSTPPVPPSPSATAGSAGSACTAGQLRATGSMEGAAGSREGGMTLSNFSDRTCTLEGTPTITLLDGNLNPITSGVTFTSSPAGWQANGLQQPPGWPVVTLGPGDAAAVRLRWSNWCPDGRAAPLWQASIPGSGTVDVNGLDAVSPPPCNGPGQSTVEVGPFEPSTGP